MVFWCCSPPLDVPGVAWQTLLAWKTIELLLNGFQVLFPTSLKPGLAWQTLLALEDYLASQGWFSGVVPHLSQAWIWLGRLYWL